MIYRLSKSVINLKPLLLIISCLLFVNIYSQETSNIDQLELIPGKIKTYCSEGFEDKGKYLQLLLEDAVQYYEEVLNDTFSFELFVLDRRSWKKFTKPNDDELRKTLTPMQYKVTQHEGTERSYSEGFWDNKEDGLYVDVVSGEPLFSSKDGFSVVAPMKMTVPSST